MNITVIIDEIQYEINDTEEICKEILSDVNYAMAYCMGAKEQTEETNSENIAPEQLTGREPSGAGPSYDTLMEDVQPSGSSQNTTSSSPPQVAGIKKGPSWEHKNVLLFLNECIKRREDLRNPKIRRRIIFQKIQEAMIASAWVSFTTTALDIKLKNLKLRYHQILENNKKTTTGRGRMPWPCFDLVSEVFAGEVRVKDAPTISSLNPSVANAVANAGGPCSNALHSEAPRSRKSDIFKERLLNIEERKLAVAQEILAELREIRKLKREALDRENTQRNVED